MHNIRAKPHRIKQRTILQDRRRKAYIGCVIAWKETIVQNKTDLWMVFANRNPRTNKAGKTVFWHSWNWFLHFNLYRIYNGLEPILDPPEQP